MCGRYELHTSPATLALALVLKRAAADSVGCWKFQVLVDYQGAATDRELAATFAASAADCRALAG